MGHDLRPGLPTVGEGVAVWGRSHYARRGEWAARHYGAPLIRIEDAFLRSIRPGRMGDAPLGLMVDPQGVHFDSSQPSRLERILMQATLDEPTLLARAAQGIARIQALDLSKYNLHRPDWPAPDPGYVLVVDQTRGDASIRHGGADAGTFAQMLARARADHPGARIVIKSHPETAAGLRPGHFGPGDCDARTQILSDPVSPWKLIAGAVAVYTVTSQLGFEAILAGHRPQVFGQPFYAGWGLSHDHQPVVRRTRSLTAEQLFAGAMILAPVWYDPCRDDLCSLEAVLDQFEAELRAFRQDRDGHIACGMRLWKRARMQRIFGQVQPLRFCDTPAQAVEKSAVQGRGLLIWGAAQDPAFADAPRLCRVEDGFLRSRGLGAELVPPISLIADDLGIHYDPARESRLERLIAAPLPPGGQARVEALVARLVGQGISKYNLGGGSEVAPLPPGHRILVPGQVEDDASVLLGGTEGLRSNLALLRAVRAANPGAVVIYKPHPDVQAGLRKGAIAQADLQGLTDLVVTTGDPVPLIDKVDEVWTLTSGLGFEALLRGKPVTCLGMPFYAGWGLTRDLHPDRAAQARRSARPDITHLVHAALIDYPRYYDPVSGRPCPPEVALDRLATGEGLSPPARLRALGKVQGWFAGYARFWR